MNKLISDELDVLGLSYPSIALSVIGGTVGVTLVLTVVLLAQSLFYASRGANVSSLISTLTPCAALLANKLSGAAGESASFGEKIDNVDATVTSVLHQAEAGENALQESSRVQRRAKGGSVTG